MLSNFNLSSWRNSENGNHITSSLGGYLWKMKRGERRLVPQWTQRWCTIEGVNFKWYSNETTDASQCSGTIPLATVTGVKELRSLVGGAYCFVITCPTRQMVLRATSNGEMEKWIRALLFQADLARGGTGTNINLSATQKISSARSHRAISLEEELGQALNKLNKLEKDVKISNSNLNKDISPAKASTPKKQQSSINKQSSITYVSPTLKLSSNPNSQKQLDEFYSKAFAEDSSDSDDSYSHNDENDVETRKVSSKNVKHIQTNASVSKQLPSSNSSSNSFDKHQNDSYASATTESFPIKGKSKPKRDYNLEDSNDSVDSVIQSYANSRNRNGNSADNTRQSNSSYPQQPDCANVDEEYIHQTQIEMIRDNEFRQKMKIESQKQHRLPLFDSDDEEIPEMQLTVKGTTRRNNMTNANPNKSSSLDPRRQNGGDSSQNLLTLKESLHMVQPMPADVGEKPARLLGEDHKGDIYYHKKQNPVAINPKPNRNDSYFGTSDESKGGEYNSIIPSYAQTVNKLSRKKSINTWIDDDGSRN